MPVLYFCVSVDCCRINNQRVMELEAQVEDLQEANQTAAAGNMYNRISLPAASVICLVSYGSFHTMM